MRLTKAAIALAIVSMKIAPANAQIAPQQHLACGASYNLLNLVLGSEAEATRELRSRGVAANAAYSEAVNVLPSKLAEAAIRATTSRIEAYNAGKLTVEQAVSDVWACDKLYGKPEFVVPPRQGG